MNEYDAITTSEKLRTFEISESFALLPDSVNDMMNLSLVFVTYPNLESFSP